MSLSSCHILLQSVKLGENYFLELLHGNSNAHSTLAFLGVQFSVFVGRITSSVKQDYVPTVGSESFVALDFSN